MLIGVGPPVSTRGGWLIHKRHSRVQGEMLIGARGECWLVQEGVGQYIGVLTSTREVIDKCKVGIDLNKGKMLIVAGGNVGLYKDGILISSRGG